MSEQDYEQLTLFQAGFPVSPSPLPASNEARRMTATSGQKWLGLSKNSGPLGLLEKMLLESLSWHSPIFYLSWKPKDIGQGHFLYQLVLSEPDTEDTGWQSWPTPTAADSYTDRMKSTQQKPGSRHSVNLSDAVKMWPTPRGNETGCYQMSGKNRDRKTLTLTGMVKLYNTPTAQESKNSTLPESQIKRDSLVGDVMWEMFATPQARDYRTGQSSRWEDKEHRRRERPCISSSSYGTTQSCLGGMADGISHWLDGYWDVEPDIPRIAKGIPNRVERLKGLGNAVVPQQFYPVLKAIVDVERSRYAGSI